MKTVTTLPALILASVCLFNVNAQTDQPQLSLGVIIERTMTSTDAHTFGVKSNPGTAPQISCGPTRY